MNGNLEERELVVVVWWILECDNVMEDGTTGIYIDGYRMERMKGSQGWSTWGGDEMRGSLLFGISMQKGVCGSFTMHNTQDLLCVCFLLKLTIWSVWSATQYLSELARAFWIFLRDWGVMMGWQWWCCAWWRPCKCSFLTS